MVNYVHHYLDAHLHVFSFQTNDFTRNCCETTRLSAGVTFASLYYKTTYLGQRQQHQKGRQDSVICDMGVLLNMLLRLETDRSLVQLFEVLR